MLRLDLKQEGYIEGYAAALQDLMLQLTGENWCGKSYDPMTIEGATAHSYAYEMKDGGRHHDLSLYTSVDEVTDGLLNEVSSFIKRDYTIAEKP